MITVKQNGDSTVIQLHRETEAELRKKRRNDIALRGAMGVVFTIATGIMAWGAYQAPETKNILIAFGMAALGIKSEHTSRQSGLGQPDMLDRITLIDELIQVEHFIGGKLKNDAFFSAKDLELETFGVDTNDAPFAQLKFKQGNRDISVSSIFDPSDITELTHLVKTHIANVNSPDFQKPLPAEIVAPK